MLIVIPVSLALPVTVLDAEHLSRAGIEHESGRSSLASFPRFGFPLRRILIENEP